MEIKCLVNTHNGISFPACPSPVIVKLSQGKITLFEKCTRTEKLPSSKLKNECYISNDLARVQQIQPKLLVDELSRRRNSGENVVIFCGKVVPKQYPPSHVMSVSPNNFILNANIFYQVAKRQDSVSIKFSEGEGSV